MLSVKGRKIHVYYNLHYGFSLKELNNQTKGQRSERTKELAHTRTHAQTNERITTEQTDGRTNARTNRLFGSNERTKERTKKQTSKQTNNLKILLSYLKVVSIQICFKSGGINSFRRWLFLQLFQRILCPSNQKTYTVNFT